MELKIRQRPGNRKSETAQARRSGQIPAVIYKQGLPGHPILLEESSFSAFMRGLKPGSLPTMQLDLVDEHSKRHKVIIKEIQYHPTTYQVMHLDFLELSGETAISVKVPIEFTGVADCAGIKQGGVLRQVLRYARVRCLPRNLPKAFSLDVKDLAINQSRRLKDIDLGREVRLLDNLNEVVVVIAKR